MVGLVVIVPVGRGDGHWQFLLQPLARLASLTALAPASRVRCSVVFSVVDLEEADLLQARTTELSAALAGDVHVHRAARPGRAVQMNEGVRAADRLGWLAGESVYLWFLHADTRVPEQTMQGLVSWLAESASGRGSRHLKDHVLWYFELAFYHDPNARADSGAVQGLSQHSESSEAPSDLAWNARGANLRSRVLRLPFGDQGFLLSAKLFERLQAYPEHVAYGEDHLLIWRAHHIGVPVRPMAVMSIKSRSTIATAAVRKSAIRKPARLILQTSSRKYREQGWLYVTSKHLLMTLQQALPQFGLLVLRRLWGLLSLSKPRGSAHSKRA